MRAKPQTGSQAVVRALRLLKLFNDGTTQLSVAQAVAATGLNRTTAFRLLSTLESEGFLERFPNGAYGLGPELMALGGYAVRHNNLVQAAHPILVDLVADARERATMEILSTSSSGLPSMLVIDEIHSGHRLSVRDFVGNHLPIHATSTGKALLAFMEPKKRDGLLAHPLTQLTEHTRINASILAVELEQICEQGYATAMEELEEGLIALAAPVFNAHGQPIASICLVGPSVRVTTERIGELVQKLKAASQKISAKIGYRS